MQKYLIAECATEPAGCVRALQVVWLAEVQHESR